LSLRTRNFLCISLRDPRSRCCCCSSAVALPPSRRRRPSSAAKLCVSKIRKSPYSQDANRKAICELGQTFKLLSILASSPKKRGAKSLPCILRTVQYSQCACSTAPCVVMCTHGLAIPADCRLNPIIEVGSSAPIDRFHTTRSTTFTCDKIIFLLTH
jgi:hypothetical protein